MLNGNVLFFLKSKTGGMSNLVTFEHHTSMLLQEAPPSSNAAGTVSQLHTKKGFALLSASLWCGFEKVFRFSRMVTVCCHFSCFQHVTG